MSVEWYEDQAERLIREFENYSRLEDLKEFYRGLAAAVCLLDERLSVGREDLGEAEFIEVCGER